MPERSSSNHNFFENYIATNSIETYY